jgi:hypothetical protein
MSCKTAAVLNEALATELVCVLRCKRHYYLAKGIDAKPVAQSFRMHGRRNCFPFNPIRFFERSGLLPPRAEGCLDAVWSERNFPDASSRRIEDRVRNCRRCNRD